MKKELAAMTIILANTMISPFVNLNNFSASVEKKLNANKSIIDWSINIQLYKKQEQKTYCAVAVVQSILHYFRPNEDVPSQEALAIELNTSLTTGTRMSMIESVLGRRLTLLLYNRVYNWNRDSLLQLNTLSRVIWTLYQNLLASVPVCLHVAGHFPRSTDRTNGHTLLLYRMRGNLESPQTIELFLQDPHNLQTRRILGSELQQLADNPRFPFISAVCHQI